VSFPIGIEVTLELDIGLELDIELEPDMVLIVFVLVPELVIVLD
jgi:hypothetical protein